MSRLSQSTEGLMGSEREIQLATQEYERLKSAEGRECTKGMCHRPVKYGEVKGLKCQL